MLPVISSIICAICLQEEMLLYHIALVVTTNGKFWESMHQMVSNYCVAIVKLC